MDKKSLNKGKKKYYILPVHGKKVIGRMVKPTRKNKEGLSKKDATILDDVIKFHGAKLKVSVFNGYPSRLKFLKSVNIAADRIVTLEENGLIVNIDKHIAGIRIKKNNKKRAPLYSSFLWEIKKSTLKKMPILLSYDKKGKLAEIEILM